MSALQSAGASCAGITASGWLSSGSIGRSSIREAPQPGVHRASRSSPASATLMGLSSTLCSGDPLLRSARAACFAWASEEAPLIRGSGKGPRRLDARNKPIACAERVQHCRSSTVDPHDMPAEESASALSAGGQARQPLPPHCLPRCCLGACAICCSEASRVTCAPEGMAAANCAAPVECVIWDLDGERCG